LYKFDGPGADEDIRLDPLKYLEKRGNFRRVMLTIGIKGDDHLIIFLEDIPEPCPEGSTLSKIRRVFQEMRSVFQSNPFSLIYGTVIHNDQIHPERPNLLQDRAKSHFSIIGRDEDTDLL